MAVDLATFRLRYPEFDTVADARVELALADAILEVSETVWGTLYERGAFALSAHFLAIYNVQQKSAGGVGTVSPVSSRSAGGVSVSFGIAQAGSKTEEAYSSTSYGQEYLRLMSLLVGARSPVVVAGPY